MEPTTFYFEGVDPAPAEGARSDDGALVALRADLREGVAFSDQEMDYTLSAVYAERVTARRKLSARDWAGKIHGHHRDFRLSALLIDPNHGGRYITRELATTRVPIEGVETEVKPLCSPDDPVPFGDPILFLFKRGDCGIEELWPKLAGDDCLNDAAYTEVRHMLDRTGCAFPKVYAEWTREEKHLLGERALWALKNLSSRNLEPKGSLIEQLPRWQVDTLPDGTEKYTRNNAHVFAFTGKKDLGSAFVMAYIAFRIWLRRNATVPPMPEEDLAGCSAF